MTYKPNLEQARTMLKALAPHDGTFFTFATIKGKATQHFYGSLEQYASQLTQLNQQGAGVYVTVNQTNGQGRKAENITAVRALFVDFDTVEPDRVEKLLSLYLFYEGILEPSLIVESSTGKHHAYWILDTPSNTQTTLKNFSQWQKRLISFFDSLGDSPDKAIHDLSRVMRLAGFYHIKGEPVLTKVIHLGKRYTLGQLAAMVDSLPTIEPASQNRIENKTDSKGSIADCEDFTKDAPIGLSVAEIKHYLGFITDNTCYKTWLEIGMILHHELKGELEGLELWNDWAATAPNYSGYNDLAAKWQTFDSKPKDKPATARTLIHLAKQSPNFEPCLSEWGELEPLRENIIINNPYPLDAFTSDLQAVIAKTAYYMQVPQSVAGQAVLGALSTMCQPYVNSPFEFSHNPSSIYLITQLDSGDGKTQTNKFIYKAINEVDKEKGKAYRDNLEQYTAELASMKPKERALYVLGNPPPKDETFLISKSTLQFILHKFIVGKAYNLSLNSGEAGQFFGGYSMNIERIGETASELANIYSGEPVEYKTLSNQKDGNNLKAYDVRLTIDILGQPIIFKAVFANPLLMKQGFLARFLVSFEPSLAGKRVYNDTERLKDDPHRDSDMLKFWDKCKAFYDRVPTDISIGINGTPDRYNMPFDVGAMQYLNEYRQTCENRLLNEFIDFKETAKRLAENASRIATLMAYFDGLEKLPIAYLEKGILLAEYSINELMRYNNQTQTSEKNDSEKLIDWLVKKAKEKATDKMNWSFIYHNAPYGMQKNKKLLLELLETLESANYIQASKTGKALNYEINPQLLK